LVVGGGEEVGRGEEDISDQISDIRKQERSSPQRLQRAAEAAGKWGRSKRKKERKKEKRNPRAQTGVSVLREWGSGFEG
jgi:hypothetical protein